MFDVQADRPARLQMIVVLILLLVLVAIPLYLWRRPRAEPVATPNAGAASSASTELSAAPPSIYAAPPSGSARADETKLVSTEARVLACHDSGSSKKIDPANCEHLVEFEKSLAAAIEENASCVPKDAGGGTIVYVADVSFKRKSAVISTPKDGRSIKNAKVVAACQAAIRAKVHTVPLDALVHQHTRYRISVTASYAGMTGVTKP